MTASIQHHCGCFRRRWSFSHWILFTRGSPSETCGRDENDVKLRRAGVAATFIGGNALLYSYMKNAWWSGERADFFFRADWARTFATRTTRRCVRGIDLARFGAAFLRSACISKPKAIAYSAAYAAAFQLQIEIWDGMFEKYGFSYADLLANTTGTALAVLHETHPRTRAIKPTISYARTAALRNSDNFPSELRPSLDYSGQTYWLSADVNALLSPSAKPYWPRSFAFQPATRLPTGSILKRARTFAPSAEFFSLSTSTPKNCPERTGSGKHSSDS